MIACLLHAQRTRGPMHKSAFAAIHIASRAHMVMFMKAITPVKHALCRKTTRLGNSCGLVNALGNIKQISSAKQTCAKCRPAYVVAQQMHTDPGGLLWAS